MCLIIHKPKHASINLELLQSASQFNPDGFGLMAFSGHQKINIVRSQATHFEELKRAYKHFAKSECVIHLRLRTRGHVNTTNTHPFRITGSIYMAHNGTLDISCRIPGRSDSWHMANDLLKPILQRSPTVLHNKSFQSYIAQKIGSHNRMVFMDADQQKTIIINQSLGTEYQGVWLSNTKWFDAAQFGLQVANITDNKQKNIGCGKLKLLVDRFGANFNHFC